MALNDALLNIGANAMGAAATHIAIHTALPDAAGSNQATSARVVASWPGATAGDLVITNKNFTGGTPNGAAQYVGFWSALTGGVFYGSQALTGDQNFNAAGEYTITSLAVNGSST